MAHLERMYLWKWWFSIAMFNYQRVDLIDYRYCFVLVGTCRNYELDWTSISSSKNTNYSTILCSQWNADMKSFVCDIIGRIPSQPIFCEPIHSFGLKVEGGICTKIIRKVDIGLFQDGVAPNPLVDGHWLSLCQWIFGDILWNTDKFSDNPSQVQEDINPFIGFREEEAGNRLKPIY